MEMKKVLTIAGSDTSGGAGIQADLKTFQEHGVYGMTALTTIVTMDPDNHWSHGVHPVPIDTIEAQLKTAMSVGIDAMKTGMLATAEIIEVAAKHMKASGSDKIVIDPVMVCKGEDEVLNPEAPVAMREFLLPIAAVVTPNLFEAGQLSQLGPIRTVDQMKEAAQKIVDLGAKSVVIKGGKQLEHEKALDLFYDGSDFTVLEAEKVATTYNHGAGCTFAAAVTANLANGKDMKTAVSNAKDFVSAAIRHGFKLNEYVGPVMHGAFNRIQK
ncbi:pyridoxine/pyridoxal/pyridoxamine kinase [Bacillus thermotolerans]|uniref:pyridoxal kinase n=1 Tax=Bacillus thermotolerans TaxID=1221996 RepID=A0A0F5I6C2_BACTR|nr:pyridoxine/pyridoxal/pyridoxamine kinase [Bacillus thermotolerans]KKB36469.1 Hydroxymethylpyrimidine phosphate kinase ThiD [Bacillus thermotolerans]KKB40126.1 Hydroxymethylpyrimidine phosphate kinase ThiD [Bacillus thermotolerans]KKB41061.1 Hydroxymethylpyrimidine phosphate kinase ThiD [Bacillus thermotolerans]